MKIPDDEDEDSYTINLEAGRKAWFILERTGGCDEVYMSMHIYYHLGDGKYENIEDVGAEISPPKRCPSESTGRDPRGGR